MKICFQIILMFFTICWANSLEQIRQDKVVRIGVLEDQPPFSVFRDDKFDGFEITLAKKIAEEILNGEGEVKFIPIKANQRIQVLQNNEVDVVIATLTVTEERKKLVEFSTPYLKVHIGVLTPKGSNIKQERDLIGKKILIESGTTAEIFFKNKKQTIISCHTAGDCYRRLKAGEADAMANDNLIVLAFPMIDSDFEVNIKNLGKPDFLGIAVAKNNDDLKKLIDEKLIKLSKEGFFKDAFENYLNVFYSGTAESRYFLLDDVYSFFG